MTHEPEQTQGAADEAAPAEAVEETAAEAAAATPDDGDHEAALRADVEKYLDLAKRTQADFENYRKRMAREVAASTDRGAAKLVKELLPAIDHLELALQAAADDESELAKGVRLVRDELHAGLGRAGVQPFSPEGEPFDPTEHEAMAQQPAEGVEPGTVVTVYQTGYRLNGQVLRAARVVVAA